MSRFSRSKRWLLIAALSSTTAAPGCKSGASMSMWNPFAKAGPSPNLVQSEPNNYVQPNMPQSSTADESSWTAPFKKLGDTMSSPFKGADKSESAKIAELDTIALANKVAEPKASLYVQLAKMHERNGKLNEAVGEYDRALDIDPKDLSALLGLAQMYDRIGRYEEALVFYGRAIKVAPDNATIHNDLGLCLARSDNMKDAAAAMRRAVSLDPKKVLYRNNLATVLLELGRVDEAYETLESVHGAAVAHYNVGFLLNKKQRQAEALKHFELAATLDPSLKEAHQWVASLGGKPLPASVAKSSPSPVVETPVVAPAPAPALAPAAPVNADSIALNTAPAKATDNPVAAEVSQVPAATAVPATPAAPAAPAATTQPQEAPAGPALVEPLINAELTNIPRPSITKQVAPPAASSVAAAAPPVSQPSPAVRRDSTFGAANIKDEPAAKSLSAAGDARPVNPYVRQSAPSVSVASLPRTPAAAQSMPPLPEQISTVDVPETKSGTKSKSSTAAASSAPAGVLSSQPKFPASRY